MIRRLVILTAILVTLTIIGVMLWVYVFKAGYQLALTAFLLGTITFLGFIIAAQSSGRKGFFSKDHLRTAITASVMITYLFILCFNIFLKTPTEMSPITTSLVTSLTSLVTVTIAFYFGASAAVQIFGKGETNKEDPDENQ